MRTSEQINEIAAALAKAQSAMKNAALNKVNPHFKNRYADLAAIRDAVVPALAANQIAVTQIVEPTDTSPVIVTRLAHSSGQWFESTCPLYGVGDMQKMGSAITYARRYSLSAICGISADEDDDGEAASTAATTQSVVMKPPNGYDNWWADMTSVADEGLDALKAAWLKSKQEYRDHTAETRSSQWNALKAKAAKVKKLEPVGA